ncbi:hypothetical protein KCU88_g7055, partial [Aureobasidium melanogenum]
MSTPRFSIVSVLLSSSLVAHISSEFLNPERLETAMLFSFKSINLLWIDPSLPPAYPAKTSFLPQSRIMAQLPPVMAGPSVNLPGMARAPVDPRKVAEFFARMPKRTQRIARSLRAIYRLFVKIGYIEHRDIKYPPHDLDGHKCLRMGMSLAAVQFLEALPWAIAGSGDMIPNSPIVDFGSTTSLLAAERIHNATGQHPADRKNGFIALTNFGENGRGYALVLDVAKGKSSTSL